MKQIRVLLKRERAGRYRQFVYVAIGLEEFVATQGDGDPENKPFDVVDALGDMFDVRDVLAAQYGADPAPEAPKDLLDLWDAATPVGERRLGIARIAEIRQVQP